MHPETNFHGISFMIWILALDVHLCPRKYEDKNSCRSYKILSFIDRYADYAAEYHSVLYEIYNFNSSLWRTQHGVSLKGNT